MRVLQIGPYPPPHGGVQSNLVAIREFLRRRNIPELVVNITRHRQQESDGVYYPKRALDLVKLLYSIPYDVAHLHLGGELTNRLLALSLVVCTVPGKKTVLTFHSGGYPGSPAGRTARPFTLRGFVLRRFDFLIGVNQELQTLFQRFGVAAERTACIQPHALKPPENQPLPERAEAFFAGHSPVLMTVGLLEPEYDLSRQIDVLEAILRRHPGAGLFIAGSGALEANLRAQIATKSYASRVMLFGDLAHAHTLEAIRRCRLFLRTTLYDGDSVSVREALFLGTPVIATDNSMRPPGCILVPIAQSEPLAAAILHALDQPRPEPVAAPQAMDDNIDAVYQIYRHVIS
jgi:glycosyltransferase involved in cell wall biosynthesis